MIKTINRWFGGAMKAQVKWLNGMADKGLRLSGTTIAGYVFEECQPGKVEYAVEFVGHLSRERADEYARFLEGLGYRTFFKNLNLDWNMGKVEVRPWAEKGARLARNGTTYNRELLIVEKERDGRPFELRTTVEGKLAYAKKLVLPWVWFFAVFAVLAVSLRSWPFAIPAGLALVVIVIYLVRIAKLKKESRINE